MIFGRYIENASAGAAQIGAPPPPAPVQASAAAGSAHGPRAQSK
jgi:hypothetical protein